MAREIFNPNLALFVSVPEGGTTFQPNPNSVVQSDTGVSHLEFFKFVGKLVGKALYDGQIMDAYFTRSFYKHMLGQPLTYEVRGQLGRGSRWHAVVVCEDAAGAGMYFAHLQLSTGMCSNAAVFWSAGNCSRPMCCSVPTRCLSLPPLLLCPAGH
jgi:hypothetical protein